MSYPGWTSTWVQGIDRGRAFDEFDRVPEEPDPVAIGGIR